MSQTEEENNLNEQKEASYVDIAFTVVPIILYCIDIVSDYTLAATYYSDRNYIYLATTLACIHIPAAFNSLMSHRMYLVDLECKHRTLTKLLGKWTSFLFPIAPLLRDLDCLKFGIKSRMSTEDSDKLKYLKRMQVEKADVALLKVFEAFLEAAPQLVLQLAITLYSNGNVFNDYSDTKFYLQWFSIVGSFGSMAWTMASFYRSQRTLHNEEFHMTWSATSVQFVWQALIIISRIVSLACFGALYPVLAIELLIIHWLAMFFWISYFTRDKEFLHDDIYNSLLTTAFGLVYIFNYIPIMEGSNKKKYLIYYTVLFIENLSIAVLFMFQADDWMRTYSNIIIPLILATFIVGLIFILIYYSLFHPKTSQNSFYSEQGLKEHLLNKLSVLS